MNQNPTSLFIFAHQDDESACFFEIERLTGSGSRVIIAYMTSGTLSGSESLVRNKESLAVLKKLGVDKGNVFFLGTDAKIADGVLCQNLTSALQMLIDLISKIGIPENIYFHAWEGGHQDHDASHLVGIALAKRLNIIDNCYQFPLYNGFNLPSIFFRLFCYLSENGIPQLTHIPWKKRIKFVKLCFYYKSQLKTWIGLFPFFLIHYIFYGTQILQKVSILRIKQPPHNNKLLYERRGFYSYNNFAQEAKIFLEESGI